MIVYATIDTERKTVTADLGDDAYRGWTEWYNVNFDTMTIGTLIEDIEEDIEERGE